MFAGFRILLFTAGIGLMYVYGHTAFEQMTEQETFGSLLGALCLLAWSFTMDSAND